MNLEGTCPWQYELTCLQNATLDACDELNGVTDGVLQNLDACTFDPITLRGKHTQCLGVGGLIRLSDVAIRTAKIIWQDGTIGNVNTDMHMSKYGFNLLYMANPACSNLTCAGDPKPLAVNWMTFLVAKYANWNPRSIKSLKEPDAIPAQSVCEYLSGF